MSGAIHSIGTDITSVVRCLVTPSSSAEGTKDHASHRARRPHVIVSGAGSTTPGAPVTGAVEWPRAAHAALSTTSAAYPTVNSRAWPRSERPRLDEHRVREEGEQAARCPPRRGKYGSRSWVPRRWRTSAAGSGCRWTASGRAGPPSRRGRRAARRPGCPGPAGPSRLERDGEGQDRQASATTWAIRWLRGESRRRPACARRSRPGARSGRRPSRCSTPTGCRPARAAASSPPSAARGTAATSRGTRSRRRARRPIGSRPSTPRAVRRGGR